MQKTRYSIVPAPLAIESNTNKTTLTKEHQQKDTNKRAVTNQSRALWMSLYLQICAEEKQLDPRN